MLSASLQCSEYDTKLSDGETLLQDALSAGIVEYTDCIAELLGNVEYPFIAITPRSTLAWIGST